MKYESKYATCVIGRGTCYTLQYRTENGSGHVSGFSPREAYERADTVVDLTMIPWDEACEFSIFGPMTGALSIVAADVWLTIAASYGAHISKRGEPGFGYEAYLARHEALVS